MCKGFEVGVYRVCLRNIREVSVIGEEWFKDRVVEDEVWEVMGIWLYGILEVIEGFWILFWISSNWRILSIGRNDIIWFKFLKELF